MPKLFTVSLALVLLLLLGWSSVPSPTIAAPQWQSYTPPAWVLGPIQGTNGSEKTVLDNLTTMQKWNIPITAFHFDAPDWMTCTGNAQFRYSDAVLNKMRSLHVRALFWLVPLIGIECPEYQVALANHYFVTDDQNNVIVTDNFTGHGSWLNFDNPDAVAWWHTLLDSLLVRTGDVIAGFYTDSVRPDDRAGQVAYGEAYGMDLLTYTRAHIPDGDVVFKRFGDNTPSDSWLNQNAHLAYVNDLPTSFDGMKIGILRVFDSTTLMPLPYNEFSGFASHPPDAETYIRRMHWGAFQPVMENVPKTAQPWSPQYPPLVMQTYRYYATLHAELAPYLSSYDQAAYETKTPILRQLNPNRFSAALGNEFWVQYVTGSVTSVNLKPPPGDWINYWDESQIIHGGTVTPYSVPLGKEPILIANGAIIPMDVRTAVTGHGKTASAGSLTINAYPIQHSSFHYHDPTNGWLTLDVTTTNKRAALCTLDAVPSQPLIWRVANVRTKPNQVTVQNGAIGINTAWGTPIPQRITEIKVERAATGWFYDATQKRLIVKLSALGTDCPAP